MAARGGRPALLCAVVLSLPSNRLWAQSGPPSLPDEEGAAEEEVVLEELEEPLTMEERLAQLEGEVTALKQEMAQSTLSRIQPPAITFFGYIDFGFFVPQGDGAGWVQDIGNQEFPEYEGKFGWVFVGDILATTVNSRGEAADLGEAPGADRFDSINSDGAPGFIVNEVTLGVRAPLGPSFLLTTSVNFVPRTGSEFALGDFFNLDIAQVEWLLDDSGDFSIWAGKFDPVFGIEYKERRASNRFGITPSLIQRYTSGTQLGIKFRGKFFDDWLILAAAITNGSSTTEQFHFYDEVDRNAGKTASGRLSVRIPVGSVLGAGFDGHVLEIGGSGEFGSQDRARNNEGELWFVGVDLEYQAVDFSLKGQLMRGKAPGLEIDDAWELDLNWSGYLEANYMVLPQLGLLVRGGVRDARVALGTERLYLTKSWRVTGGLRFVVNDHITIKAEYLKNGEFGGIDEIDNDIFTSSAVFQY